MTSGTRDKKVALEPGIEDTLFQYLMESKTALDATIDLLPNVQRASVAILSSLSKGGKLLVCGNGGSAADAQHFAAELTGRYESVRKGLPAITLSGNSSMLTAISNDFGYEGVFERQIEALAKPVDVFIGISTSAKSANVLRAAERAKDLSLCTIILTGQQEGPMSNVCDILLRAPSRRTSVVQQIHIVLLHMISLLIDEEYSSI